MESKRDEPVRLEAKRFGFLPAAFCWRGHRYDVWKVERTWILAQGRGSRRLERRYFRVHCERGVFELYHDLLANTWGIRAGGARHSLAGLRMGAG